MSESCGSTLNRNVQESLQRHSVAFASNQSMHKCIKLLVILYEYTVATKMCVHMRRIVFFLGSESSQARTLHLRRCVCAKLLVARITRIPDNNTGQPHKRSQHKNHIHMHACMHTYICISIAPQNTSHACIHTHTYIYISMLCRILLIS